MPTPHTLLCTVGTSLFYPNLSALAREPQADPVRAALARTYANQDWPEVAAQLRQRPPTERLCGAEINSVADLLSHGHVETGRLHLLFSDTADSERIAAVLDAYFTIALAKPDACEPWEQFSDDWDERFEPLVNREKIDGQDYLELSATGQIFHETFRSRFQQHKATGVPRDAMPNEKRSPKLGDDSFQQARGPILRFLQKLTDERPYVVQCYSTYWNPDLSEANRFRLSGGEVQGVYSKRLLVRQVQGAYHGRRAGRPGRRRGGPQ